MKKDKPEMTEKEEEDLRQNPVNVFRCGCKDCKQLDAMVFEEFKHHLFAVHNLKSDQLKGKKQMTLHMDGEQWFSSTYQWTLETGLEFTQSITMARERGDMMRRMG